MSKSKTATELILLDRLRGSRPDDIGDAFLRAAGRKTVQHAYLAIEGELRTMERENDELVKALATWAEDGDPNEIVGFLTKLPPLPYYANSMPAWGEARLYRELRRTALRRLELIKLNNKIREVLSQLKPPKLEQASEHPEEPLEEPTNAVRRQVSQIFAESIRSGYSTPWESDTEDYEEAKEVSTPNLDLKTNPKGSLIQRLGRVLFGGWRSG